MRGGVIMNFEDLGRKVKKFSRSTMEEVQKMNEVRQLNGKVNEAQKQIRNLYSEMGKKLYEHYKEEALVGFEAEIHAISDKFVRIEELKEQIRQVKGVVLCPCCHMEVSAAERFCSNCGNKMPEVFEIVDDDEQVEAVDVESEDVTETVQEAAETAAETVQEATEEAAETAEEVTEAAAETVQETTATTAAEAAEEVTETSAETAQETTATAAAAETVEEVTEVVEEATEAAAEAASEAQQAETAKVD